MTHCTCTKHHKGTAPLTIAYLPRWVDAPSRTYHGGLTPPRGSEQARLELLNRQGQKDVSTTDSRLKALQRTGREVFDRLDKLASTHERTAQALRDEIRAAAAEAAESGRGRAGSAEDGRVAAAADAPAVGRLRSGSRRVGST